ncbi:hypothetical protein GTHT12_01118 [Geobacillus thermodenitrificans]|nr:hypothetical protein GTHT12_01118 [Geobacillus thermodenitrificans]KQB93470.1 hypothetical protein GEPA3_1612 [Geobacillus sp. PA-3]
MKKVAGGLLAIVLALRTGTDCLGQHKRSAHV